jgi:hypothetical protein
MTNRQKYDFERLDKYCKENNVTLLENYSNVKLNSVSIIKGKCSNKDCVKNYGKSFKTFEFSGGYCLDCSKNNKMNKMKQTNLLKYGYDFPFSSEKVLVKSKDTCMKKYGVDNFLQTENIKNIRKEKCFEKYGVNYYLQSNIVKENMKKNNIKKYNVDYPSQNNEIMEKISKKSYKFKQYKLPSGNTIKIQGYENFALDELIINNNINELDIITGVKNVPELWYFDEKNIKHRHYVDIFIPNENKCIEVKSTWTLQKKKDNVFLKQCAAKELGYKYEIWVYDKKGNKTCYD